MIKSFLKKFAREDEPEELDTGYDSGYYGGQKDSTSAAPKGYEEPEYNSGREYVPAGHTPEPDYRQPKREGGYEEEVYVSRTDRSYTRPVEKPVNKGTVFFTPDFYSDKREEMVTGFAEGHVVMINTNHLESMDRMRLVDYLMGAVCAMQGKVDYRNGILALAPKGVEVDEADYELLEEEIADVTEDEADQWEDQTEWWDDQGEQWDPQTDDMGYDDGVDYTAYTEEES